MYLIDSDGLTVIDSITWVDSTGLNVDDISIGRMPDGGAIWQLFGAGQTNPCTPGAANQGAPNTAPVISNISYNPNPAMPNIPITISAQATDAENNLSMVELLWGVNDYTSNTTAMTLQNDEYSAAIGMFELGTAIQFRIKATDSMNAETVSPIYNIVIGFQASTLYINELMPSNTTTATDEYGDYEDWVEIYNPNSFPVNLAGYYLTDNHYNDGITAMTQISSAQPDSTTIPAGGFIIFWFDEEMEEGILHINTKLGTSADAVYLVAPDMLSITDSVIWTSQTGFGANLSYGRYPDGSDTWTLFGGGNPNPVTLGSSNSQTSNEDEYTLVLIPSLSLFPNPMHNYLNIDIRNAKTSSQVKIYNLKGQIVTELKIFPGAKAVWDGKDKAGLPLSSGIYFCRMNCGTHTSTSKFILIK